MVQKVKSPPLYKPFHKVLQHSLSGDFIKVCG
jgi:hypothetical protein